MTHPCPRCQGFIYDNGEGPHCLCCGHYLVTPLAPPIEVNENRRWESVLCTRCHRVTAQRGRSLCRACHNHQPVQEEQP